MRFVLYFLVAINAACAIMMACYAVADFTVGTTGAGALDVLIGLANVTAGLYCLHTAAEIY